MIGEVKNVLDLSYLDLMADGDKEMKKTMLSMLLEELPGEVKNLAQACEDRNHEQLKNVAHKMKSTLTFVGNAAMTEANGNCERIGMEEGDFAEAEMHLNIVQTYLGPICTAIQNEVAKL